MKTTVVYHSADFDGLFCREIARKVLPDAELIGWDFGNDALIEKLPAKGPIYILDLPVDRALFGATFDRIAGPLLETILKRVVWIDHHVASIESHPRDITGYRIDGVAACRLAWQYFRTHTYSDKTYNVDGLLPVKSQFVNRLVTEPLAVRLAGEYDIFDKRDPRAELFQFGLRGEDLEAGGAWNQILGMDDTAERRVEELLRRGEPIKFAREQEYKDVITQQGFTVKFEGLTFLACNSHELDIRSQLFEAGIRPEHDALLGFTFNGQSGTWRVSMYHIPGKEDRDILSIAKKYGGGGHRGACGCRMGPDAPFFRPSVTPLTAGELLSIATNGGQVPPFRALATYANRENWKQIYEGKTSDGAPAHACEWAFIGPMRPGYELAQHALHS